MLWGRAGATRGKHTRAGVLPGNALNIKGKKNNEILYCPISFRVPVLCQDGHVGSRNPRQVKKNHIPKSAKREHGVLQCRFCR